MRAVNSLRGGANVAAELQLVRSRNGGPACSVARSGPRKKWRRRHPAANRGPTGGYCGAGRPVLRAQRQRTGGDSGGRDREHSAGRPASQCCRLDPEAARRSRVFEHGGTVLPFHRNQTVLAYNWANVDQVPQTLDELFAAEAEGGKVAITIPTEGGSGSGLGDRPRYPRDPWNNYPALRDRCTGKPAALPDGRRRTGAGNARHSP
jgi:hypothetical protein